MDKQGLLYKQKQDDVMGQKVLGEKKIPRLITFEEKNGRCSNKYKLGLDQGRP